MRSIWVILNIVISVGIISIPILFLGWFDKNKILTGKLTRIWARWVIWATGINYEIIGLRNIQQDKQYIFMCNHESALDILFSIACLPCNIVFLAKKELFRIPVFGWAMLAAGTMKIDRKNPERAKKSVDNAVETFKGSTFSTIIYPEGTRSDTRELLPFKKGGFILAIRSKLPLVPVTILGAGNILRKGSFKFRKGQMKIIISNPIETLDMTIEDKEKLIGRCREAMTLNKTYNANEKVRDCELFSV